MANLTIVVNDDVLRQAQARALSENRSVDAILEQHLADYAQASDVDGGRARAVSQLRVLCRQYATGSGGAHWSREDLHER